MFAYLFCSVSLLLCFCLVAMFIMLCFDWPVAGSRYVDDDEDEEDVYKICKNPGDTKNLLWYPCACSRSIKLVHQD